MSEGERYTVKVADDAAGARIDRVLADALPTLSRTRVRALIEDGRVTGSDGRALTNPAQKARAGAVYTVLEPPPAPAEPEPQNIPLDVVYEDEHLIVIDKPAGLVVHPAAGHGDGTLVNALLHHCAGQLAGIGGVTRPGIVHRLDKDTSGLLVAAKTDRAHQHLAAQFADHSIERAYKALVWGVPTPAAGTVTGNIGRSPRNRKKMAVVKRGGKPATTHYRVIRRFGSLASLMECRLETGRTHQIRVHMASIGHPVMGDPVYGGGPRRCPADAPDCLRPALQESTAQLLHAVLLGFDHPDGRCHMRFESINYNKINEVMGCLDNV